jgi:hypothetical protein
VPIETVSDNPQPQEVIMKRSLHIGINDYPGTGNDLSGCVNDANDWEAALAARDFQTNTLLDAQATKSQMIEAITGLVDSTGRDDIGVITYSGHGTWVPDEDDDEADGRDEALCPHDIDQGLILTDDELYDIFSQRKRGARIIFISDSCHSGTVSKASTFNFEGRERSVQVPRIRFLAPEIFLKNDQEGMARAIKVEDKKPNGKIKAASLLLSGCKDDEYSYDAWFNGRANGAFTYVALQALKELKADASYKKWHKAIRKTLPHVQYPQTPQLKGSKRQKTKWVVFRE